MSPDVSGKTASVLLTLLIAACLLAGLWNIDWGLPNQTHRWPYYTDEAATLTVLKSIDWAHGKICPFFVWGSFYTYLIGAVLKGAALLRLVVLEPSEAFYRQHIIELKKIYLIGRYVSIFWSCVTVYLVYQLGRLIANRKTGLLGALFVAALPFLLVHAHLMTPHIQFAALVLAALVAGLKMFTSEHPGWYVLLGVAAGLAFGTYWLLGATPLVVLLLKRKTRRAIHVFLIFSATVALVAPCLFLSSQWRAVTWHHYVGLLGPTLDIFSPLVSLLPYGFGTGLYALSLFGVLWAWRMRDARIRALLVWAASYYCLVSFGGLSVGIRRYAPLLYVLAVFAAAWVIDLWDRSENSPLVRAASGIATISVLVFTMLLSSALLITFAHDTRDSAYAWINQHVAAGSRIAVHNWFYIPHIDTAKYRVTAGITNDTLDPAQFEYCLISGLNARVAPAVRKNKNYQLIRSFTSRPSLWGLNFDFTRAPEDMRFSYPPIYLFQRRKVIDYERKGVTIQEESINKEGE